MSTLTSASAVKPAALASEQAEWRQPLFWMLSGFSLPIGGFVANLAVGSVDDALSGALAGAMAGTALGTAQWLALRGRIRNAGWWVPATALGFAAGLAAGTAIVGAGTRGSDLIISGAITGAVIGCAQFLVLRDSGRNALFWIPVMCASWAIGWAVTWAARIDVDEGWSNFGAAGVVVFGILTALTLFAAPGILRRQNSEVA